MTDLFDAAPMYDEDYLYFFAPPGDQGGLAGHGAVVPGADDPARVPRNWPGGCWTCGRA